MKISKFFVAIAAFVLSLGAQAAYTRYDFSFETDNTITANGYFTLEDGWTANNTYQAVSFYSGSLDPNTQSSVISGGTFTNFLVKSVDTLLFRFTSGGITYTANFGTGSVSDSGYELSYKPSGGTTTTSEIYNPYSTPSRPAPLTEVTPNVQVPEIDGSKLPQAALLILALVFMVRRVTAARPTAGFSTQFA
ncbi:hypothetical protein [Rhodoferax sp.]|uniref:hypothetical protein n=1 Tax=Rhodoferax sp. TaxID=50421 RepID=UPI00260F9562|nr:hypothetical protein [Rhodoferax sp.]MDD3935978.1 hypothetical protein [Rhodoferax sp.]